MAAFFRIGPDRGRGSFRLVVDSIYYDATEPESIRLGISEEALAAALHNIYSTDFNPVSEIEPNLFREVARRLRAAVDKGAAVLGEDPLAKALRHSADVFAAFKVHKAQNDMAARLTDSNGNLKPFGQWKKEVMPIASHQCGPWLETEYNTAVIRARQAVNWQQFIAEKDILPNLKWIPSTSPNPGEDHRRFWNTILPVEHPFWDRHRPGDRWNCKCDLTSTDESATPVPDDAHNSGGTDNPQLGLTGNPGKTGEVFSDNHPYYPEDCRHCTFYIPNITDKLLHIFHNKKKKCHNCKYIDDCIDNEERERIKANRVEYRRLLHDEDYQDVQFDKKNGGLKATHVGHIKHDGPNAQRFFGGLTSTDLEQECQEQLFNLGHRAVFCDESKRIRGNRLAALDLILDGNLMDIRSVTGRGWYSNIFVKKNDQLRRFNARTDITDKADSLCLYFHDPTLFNEEKMKKSINFFRFYRDDKGELLNRYLKHVHCVIKGRDEVLVFDIE